MGFDLLTVVHCFYTLGELGSGVERGSRCGYGVVITLPEPAERFNEDRGLCCGWREWCYLLEPVYKPYEGCVFRTCEVKGGKFLCSWGWGEELF